MRFILKKLPQNNNNFPLKTKKSQSPCLFLQNNRRNVFTNIPKFTEFIFVLHAL